MSPFVSLSPVKDPQRFYGIFFVQPLAYILQLLLRCRKLVQILQTGILILVLPPGHLFRYQQYPRAPAPISVELCNVWPVAVLS
jgi:hypothetical protein